jgi:hypothetical protein
MILLLSSLADGAARGWNRVVWMELVLIALVCVLSEVHARVLVPRLAEAVLSGDEMERQRRLQVSLRVSLVNMLLSLIVAVLAI